MLKDVIKKLDNEFYLLYDAGDDTGKDVKNDIKDFLTQAITEALEEVMPPKKVKGTGTRFDYEKAWYKGFNDCSKEIRGNIKQYLEGEEWKKIY